MLTKFSPKGAGLGGVMGGASEEGQVRKAQKRLQNLVKNQLKVDNATVRRFIREVTLNEKFKGTWVAEGLNDEATMSSLAKSDKAKDLIVELIEADYRADEWLAEHKKVENLALNMRDPPIVLGKYFKDFCSSRIAAYKDYKSIGIKEMVKNEEKRFEKKLYL